MDKEKAKEAFGRLLDIMDELRAKCPWDMKQTMESLRHLTVEETYELNDAIIENDLPEVSKELGDLLLHIVFYAKIGDEKEVFDITSVIDGICEKLISRHPHIYGDVEVADEEEVKANWEKLKLKEGKKSVLQGVPMSLPSMVKAIRIQDKARGIGFDWEHRGQVWEKLQEELEELKEEVDTNSPRVPEEFGDVLFSMINYARFLDVNPDDALECTNRKFIKRFQFMEAEISKDEKVMSEMALAELDAYWERSKTEA
ncbi:MAG: nucleoside triphosphate pyrophosphohydrolase [Flavobacteriales bacterium]|nr:nucleoside triphosphate pyrophosphohydrolase [Flavobacteriales bacterium]